ncbi:MAG: hypothetical protein MJZ33_02410 [Paludibacteraceae bacterium]|nr:hypothetical protein [Paludibacteraceae bacterium]
MKAMLKRTSLMVAMLMTLLVNGNATEEQTETSVKWNGTVAADLVSHYVWRGQDMAGVSLQPTLGVEYNGLSLTAWGSYSFDKDDNKEFDLTLSYAIGGLSFGVTDYWFSYPSLPTNRYFQYQAHETAHVWEGQVGYDFGFLALNWYTNFGGADGVNEDGERAYSSYFNISCPFDWVGLSWTADAGIVPWKTSFYADADKDFSFTNVGIGATKTINCSNGYSFGVSSNIIWNPSTNYGFFVVGVSL